MSSRYSQGSLRSSAASSNYSASLYEGDYNGLDVAGEIDIDDTTQEFYYGEWKNDKRNGAGVCERTDGFKYEGMWLNNRRHGYGMTTFKDGSKEEGKYKQNYFVPTRKKNLIVRAGKTKEKLENALKAARKASEVAKQKAEIAITRTQHSIAKAAQAEEAAELARDEGKIARAVAKEMSPEYHQPGLDYIRNARGEPFSGDFEGNGDFAQGDEGKMPAGELSANNFAKFRIEDEEMESDTDSAYRTQNARSKNSRGSIGRSQNSYNSLAKSSSGSSTGRFGNRSVSHSNRDGDTFNEEDPDHWITKYEQEMSTLQPRDGSAPNGSIPTAENTIPGINLTPATTEKKEKLRKRSTKPVETSSLAPSEPVAATIDELDIASTGYTPRFQSKKLEINEPAPTIDQPPENEWTRYAIFALLILLNVGFLVLFSHMS